MAGKIHQWKPQSIPRQLLQNRKRGLWKITSRDHRRCRHCNKHRGMLSLIVIGFLLELRCLIKNLLPKDMSLFRGQRSVIFYSDKPLPLKHLQTIYPRVQNKIKSFLPEFVGLFVKVCFNHLKTKATNGSNFSNIALKTCRAEVTFSGLFNILRELLPSLCLLCGNLCYLECDLFLSSMYMYCSRKSNK